MCSFMMHCGSESTNKVKEGAPKMFHNLNPAGDEHMNGQTDERTNDPMNELVAQRHEVSPWF